MESNGVLEENIWGTNNLISKPNRLSIEEQVKNMREMGEEEGLCTFLIRDNTTVGDNDILFYFLNDEAVVQDNDNCF